MAEINKKLVKYATEAKFVEDLANVTAKINPKSVVFIEDTGRIWTHGKYYDGAWAGISGKPDTYTPSAHSHGSITNDGKIGTQTNRIIETTTGGALTHVAKNTAYNRAFGTGKDQVAMGNHTHSNFTRTAAGFTPAPTTNTTTRYLREDGTWVIPPNTNTTYSTGTIAQLNAGTETAGKLQTAKNLHEWLSGKNYITNNVSNINFHNIVPSSPRDANRRFFNVAQYHTSGDVQGVIVIELPGYVASMEKLRISGWGYNKSWDIILSGYSGSSYNSWLYTGDATILGNPPFGTNDVQLAASETNRKFYVLLGTPSTVYGHYLSISVDAESYYSNSLSYTGWDIYVSPSEPPTTSKINPTTAIYGGEAQANKFIRQGGTSTQFLKADGSVDSNTYITASSIPSEISTSEIDAGTSTTVRTITGRRVKYILDKKSDSNHNHTLKLIAGTSTATTNSTADVADPYIRLFSDNAHQGNIRIVGGTNVGVVSKNGVITLTSSYTNTTYTTGTLAQLNAGNDTTGRLQTAKLLNDWLSGKNYATESYVDNIEIGGRNLLLNTNNERSGSYSMSPIYRLTEKPIVGESYTLSGWFKFSEGKLKRIMAYNSGGSVSLFTWTNNAWAYGEWFYFSRTFTWRNESGSSSANDTSVYIYGGSSDGILSYAKLIKLEKGTKATDWSPAPEDQVSDWNESNATSFSFIKNKPTKLTLTGAVTGNTTLSSGELSLNTSLTAHTHTWTQITGTIPTWNQSTTGNAATASAVSTSAENTGTTSRYILFADNASGNQALKTDTGLKYVPSTNTITATLAGNASSATKLQNTRTIWGQSFNGEGNVSGNISNTGNITPSATAAHNIGTSSLMYERAYLRRIDTQSGYNLRLNVAGNEYMTIDTSGNVGIGTTSPAYKLDVSGTGRFTGTATFNGFTDSTTNLGRTSTTYQTMASGQWGLPIGSSRFLKADSVGGTGIAGYWFVTGRRDMAGGYSGIFTPMDSGSAYIGANSASTSNPIWAKIYTDKNLVKSNSTSSTSTTDVATSKAVKDAYDKGNHSHPYAPTSHTHSGHDVKTLGNRLTVDSDGKVRVNHSSYRRAGMYGIYDSYKIGHIWSMGNSYQIAADGADFGNLYGLAYKHTNNSTGGTMGGGHQVVWATNGTPTVSLGSNVWTSGGFLKNGSSDSYALLGGGGHTALSNLTNNTGIRVGASGNASNTAVTDPYVKVSDNGTYREQFRIKGGSNVTITSDASKNITIAAVNTNTTYSNFTRTVSGLVPAPGETTTTRYLREDGTWVTPPNTNTNTYVTQNTTTTTEYRPFLLGYNTASITGNFANTTNLSYYANTLRVQPSTGNIISKGSVTAPTFIGALSGNADSANLLKDLENWDTITPVPTGTMSLTRVSVPYNGSMPANSNANAVLTINTHPGNYHHQLGFSSNGRMYHRIFTNVALNDTKAWGSLAFLTDNVASATKLQTARTIWGQSFNGTGNVTGTLVAHSNSNRFGSELSTIPTPGVSGHMLSVGPPNYATNLGTLGSGRGYIQVSRLSGSATSYDLMLQPVGGNVSIGRNNTAAGAKLDVAGTGRFAGNVTVDGNITASKMFRSSDRSLKEKIKKINLSNIDKINLIEFNWKSDNKKDYGVIAQDLEVYYPELVNTDDTGMKSVNYESLYAIKIARLEERIKELEDKLWLKN